MDKPTLSVRVNRNDIEGGLRGDPFHCPIAGALRRAVGCSSVRVTPREVTLDGRIHFRASRSFSRIVRDYDRGRGMDPLLVTLISPNERSPYNAALADNRREA